MMVTLQAVFEPAKSILLTALVLITIDLLSGALAAYKRGEKITSSGLSRTIIKLFVYEFVLCLAFLAETYLTGPYLPASKLVASMIGSAELLSIMENLNSLTNDSLLKTIVDKLNSLNKQ